MQPLIFAQFTDELAGLIAVGGAIAGAIRWLLIREKAREKRFRKERQARLSYQAATDALLKAWGEVQTSQYKKIERDLDNLTACVHAVEHKIDRLSK